MPTRITLIRHGETAWNADHRWQGQTIVPLNEEGRRQAAVVADYLFPLAGKIAAIYSSDLSRAQATAAIIAARVGKPLILDARLREIDVGEWQGLTTEEVEAWDGVRLAAVRADPMNAARPGGKSFNQVAARAVNALEDILAAHPEQHVLAVTHGGTIRSVLYRLGLMDAGAPPIGNTALTTLVCNSNGRGRASWQLDRYNFTGHLTSILVGDPNS